MKTLIIGLLFMFIINGNGNCQTIQYVSDTIKVILENENVTVTEYRSTAGKDVCGRGRHSHQPHLTILLTDAAVALTTADGNVQNLTAPAGTAFWSEAETHMVINNGLSPVKLYLVELKNLVESKR